MVNVSTVKAPVPAAARLMVIGLLSCMATIVASDGGKTDTSYKQENTEVARATSGSVIPNHGDLVTDPGTINPPNIGLVYSCQSHITITDFLPNSELLITINSSDAPNPIANGPSTDHGIVFDTGHVFSVGDTVSVRQRRNGVTSQPSVTRTTANYRDDYPNGLPTPRLWKENTNQCGKAILAEEVVPGSTVTIFSQDKNTGGFFDPPVKVGNFVASTVWGLNWTTVGPDFKLGSKVSASASLCSDVSELSQALETKSFSGPIPTASIKEPIIDGQELISIYGKTIPTEFPELGVLLRAYNLDEDSKLFASGIPGGTYQNSSVSPLEEGTRLMATQELCNESADGDVVVVQNCDALPAAIIADPIRLSSAVEVIEKIPGAEIVVFLNGMQAGRSGGRTISIAPRILNTGDIVSVLQVLGNCEAESLYQVTVPPPPTVTRPPGHSGEPPEDGISDFVGTPGIECGCTSTGTYVNAVSPDSSNRSADGLYRVEDFGTSLAIIRESDDVRVLHITNLSNGSEYGFGPQNRFFAVANKKPVNLETVGVFDLEIPGNNVILKRVFFSDNVPSLNSGYGFSPDGRTFMLAQGTLSNQQTVVVMKNLETGQQTANPPRFTRPYSGFFRFSRCGDMFAAGIGPSNISIPPTISLYSTFDFISQYSASLPADYTGISSTSANHTISRSTGTSINMQPNTAGQNCP